MSADAVADGAEGARRVGHGVTPDRVIARDAAIGPVLPGLTFRDFDEDVALTNDSTYGLVAGVRSRTVHNCLAFGRKALAGTVWTNIWIEDAVAKAREHIRGQGDAGEDGSDDARAVGRVNRSFALRVAKGAIALATVALAASAYWWFAPRTLHVEMTCTFETGGETVAASSVLNLRFRFPLPIDLPEARAVVVGIEGHAPAVAIDDGTVVACLLDIDPTKTLNRLIATLDLSDEHVWVGNPASVAKWLRRARRLEELRAVEPVDWPQFAALDRTRPEAVRDIDPTNDTHIAPISVTVRPTNSAAAPADILELLPWLAAHRGKLKPTDKIYVSELTAEETIESLQLWRPR